MPHDVAESDWKVFRELREVALQRFCARVLDEIPRLRESTGGSPHDQYLAVYQRLQQQDQDLALAFDAPRRSRMLLHLAHMQRLDLLEQVEIARFSGEVQSFLESHARP